MILDCGLCQLRPWRAGDEDSLARHANDRDIWLNLRDRFPHPYTRAAAEEWVRFASGQHPPLNFAIVVGGQAAGGIGMMPREDVERCSAEVGYWLGREFWGRGVTTAALIALTRHAFAAHGFTRLFAVPYADNAASVRVLEKAGFRCEGRLRRSAIKAGVVKDQLMYAITDEDLRAAQAPA